jgi:Flp pilus assembly protein TadG
MRARLLLRRAWRRLRGDQRGVAAIEFALVVPAVIVVYLVGFEVAEAGTAYRKLTDTTVQLANITAQYTSMSCTDVNNVLDATAQIMSPYPTSNISIVMSEVSVNSSNVAKVVWSEEYQGTRLAVNSTVTMPSGYQNQNATSTCPPPNGQPSVVTTCYILVQTTYAYQPTIGAAFIGSGKMVGPISMQDQIFMLPRASMQIPDPNAPCTA